MILAEQLLARVLRDLAELVVDVGDEPRWSVVATIAAWSSAYRISSSRRSDCSRAAPVGGGLLRPARRECGDSAPREPALIQTIEHFQRTVDRRRSRRCRRPGVTYAPASDQERRRRAATSSGSQYAPPSDEEQDRHHVERRHRRRPPGVSIGDEDQAVSTSAPATDPPRIRRRAGGRRRAARSMARTWSSGGCRA